MRLHVEAAEYYRLTITTDPSTPAADWQASFDGAATWHDAEVVSDTSAWLVAGPSFVGSGPSNPDAIVLTGSSRPLIRLLDDPETVIRSAPSITIFK